MAYDEADFESARTMRGNDVGRDGRDRDRERATAGATEAPGGRRRFQDGDVILGRYKVLGELGQGGMGVVYRCFDEVGGVEVAVKGLPPDVSHNSDEMEGVKDNFKLVNELRHPNIAGVRVLEMDAATGDYYLVMDYARGSSLQHWMRKHAGPECRGQQLGILRQVAAALDYAHTCEPRKIIHRDIKPENIMVDETGRALVLDFGLAAQVRSSMSRVSKLVTSRSGTPAYKSPEQWKARSQHAAADQYSLGVIAYQMFAGELPFDSDDIDILKHAVVFDAVPPIPGVPKRINEVFAKVLAKEEKDRYPSCAAFVSALAGETSPANAGGGSSFVWKIAVIAGLAAVVAAGAVWFLARREARETPGKIDVREVRAERPVPQAERVVPAFDTEAATFTINLPGDDVSMRFIRCKACKLQIGSPEGEEGRLDNERRHEVSITKDYWLGRTELTQRQWKSLMDGETILDLARKAGKEDPQAQCGDVNDDVPVYWVQKSEVERFCEKLTERERVAGMLPTGYVYRLPTEAEWECACRAGTTTALPNGKDIRILGKNNAPALDDIAWYAGNSSVGEVGDSAWETSEWEEKQYPGGRAAPRKVSMKAPNAWGFFDMIGNVSELCYDCYSEMPQTRTVDPAGRPWNDCSVVRGGSWSGDAKSCRSSARRWARNDREGRLNSIGARICLGPDLTTATHIATAAALKAFDEKRWEDGWKAARSGDGDDPDILFYKGVCYDFGYAVEKNPRLANEHYRRAAMRGEPVSMRNLAGNLEKGVGAETDVAEAYDWYRKAADLGNSYALYKVGYFHENGIGRAKDTAKAIEWYEKAAAAGEKAAKDRLSDLRRNGPPEIAATLGELQKALAGKEWRKAIEFGELALQCDSNCVEAVEGVTHAQYALALGTGDAAARKAVTEKIRRNMEKGLWYGLSEETLLSADLEDPLVLYGLGMKAGYILEGASAKVLGKAKFYFGLAARRGHDAAGEALLKIERVEKAMPYFKLVRAGSLPEIKVKVNAGSPMLELRSLAGETLLHAAAGSGNVEVIRYLESLGYDANVLNVQNGWTPLFSACMNTNAAKSVACIEYLLSRGAKAGARQVGGKYDYWPYPIFHVATPEAFDCLVAHGADPQVRGGGKNEDTILHYYGRGRSLACLDRAIKALGTVDPLNGNGETPLHVAVQGLRKESPEIVRYLLERGAAVNVRNSRSETPLFKACSYVNDFNKQARLESVRLLLKHGADRNLADRNGKRPADVVKEASFRILLDGQVPVDPAPVRHASEPARKAGERKTVGLPDGGQMIMCWCPPGRFMMGSPDAEEGRNPHVEWRHEVTLTKGFWMGRTEVTQGQWKRMMVGETVHDLARKAGNENPKSFCGDIDDDVPVYWVSFEEAKAFCDKLTGIERSAGRLPEGYVYRLPTEAEWEYACRAGTTTALPNGKEIRILGKNNAPALDDIAWYAGNSSVGFSGEVSWDTDKWVEKQYVGGRAAPRKVSLKAPNAWGLFDTVGNVCEWCMDYFDGHPEVWTVDPRGGYGSDKEEKHVAKDGGWDSNARYCRPASRTWALTGDKGRNKSLGFRVCLGPDLANRLWEATARAVRAFAEKRWEDGLRLARYADGSDPQIQFYTGVCYDFGYSVAKDPEKAYRCFLQAANGGEPAAMLNLGICLQTGGGCTKNESEARRWYEKAVRFGNETAKRKLQEMGVPPTAAEGNPASRKLVGTWRCSAIVRHEDVSGTRSADSLKQHLPTSCEITLTCCEDDTVTLSEPSGRTFGVSRGKWRYRHGMLLMELQTDDGIGYELSASVNWKGPDLFELKFDNGEYAALLKRRCRDVTGLNAVNSCYVNGEMEISITTKPPQFMHVKALCSPMTFHR